MSHAEVAGQFILVPVQDTGHHNADESKKRPQPVLIGLSRHADCDYWRWSGGTGGGLRVGEGSPWRPGRGVHAVRSRRPAGRRAGHRSGQRRGAGARARLIPERQTRSGRAVPRTGPRQRPHSLQRRRAANLHRGQKSPHPPARWAHVPYPHQTGAHGAYAAVQHSHQNPHGA